MTRISLALQMVRDFAGAARKDEGQGVVEYTLIVGTVSVVLVAAFITTGIGAAITGLAGSISVALGGA